MELKLNDIYQGDSLEVLRGFPDECIDCCVTSPPYWGLRDYNADGQIGLEETPDEYVQRLVNVFREVRRILKPAGVMWLNLGDSYAAHGGDGKPGRTAKVGNTKSGCQKTTNKIVCGLKQKDLVGIPWMTDFALRADGWYLRSDVIWNKPNCMPKSVRDRPTKSHEYVFLMTKNAKYYYDAAAIKERSTCKEAHRGHTLRNSSRPSRGSFSNIPEGKTYPMKNKRDVWRVPTQSYPGAHYAVFPEKLVEPCIMAGCPIGGVVLDPFMGSGTVGVVSLRLKRNYVGVDLNPEYIKQAQERIYRGCKPLDKFDNEEVKKSVSITL